MDKLFGAIADVFSSQGDIGHITLAVVLVAAIYAIKLLRDDLKECAQNYIEDSKKATAAYTELIMLVRDLRDSQ